MDWERTTEELLHDGVTRIGFSRLTPQTAAPGFPELTGAVTLLFALTRTLVAPVKEGPTYPYFQHYRAVNAYLDSWTLRLSARLEREGWRAVPVAASQSIPPRGEYRGLFAHKTAAVAASLGWIGRSALLVTPEFGPRVRLATVLTDCPLPLREARPMPGCGECRACVEACPARAISGAPVEPGMPRETFYDPERCSQHMKTYSHIGRGAVCGICMAVCPIGGGAESAQTIRVPGEA